MSTFTYEGRPAEWVNRADGVFKFTDNGTLVFLSDAEHNRLLNTTDGQSASHLLAAERQWAVNPQ